MIMTTVKHFIKPITIIGGLSIVIMNALLMTSDVQKPEAIKLTQHLEKPTDNSENQPGTGETHRQKRTAFLIQKIPSNYI